MHPACCICGLLKKNPPRPVNQRVSKFVSYECQEALAKQTRPDMRHTYISHRGSHESQIETSQNANTAWVSVNQLTVRTKTASAPPPPACRHLNAHGESQWTRQGKKILRCILQQGMDEKNMGIRSLWAKTQKKGTKDKSHHDTAAGERT